MSQNLCFTGKSNKHNAKNYKNQIFLPSGTYLYAPEHNDMILKYELHTSS